MPMRYLVAAALLLLPVAAFADDPAPPAATPAATPTPAPPAAPVCPPGMVCLSQQEAQQILMALGGRDPIGQLLIEKSQQSHHSAAAPPSGKP